jgi:uncharacterized protein (DUF302 family)
VTVKYNSRMEEEIVKLDTRIKELGFSVISYLNKHSTLTYEFQRMNKD